MHAAAALAGVARADLLAVLLLSTCLQHHNAVRSAMFYYCMCIRALCVGMVQLHCLLRRLKAVHPECTVHTSTTWHAVRPILHVKAIAAAWDLAVHMSV